MTVHMSDDGLFGRLSDLLSPIEYAKHAYQGDWGSLPGLNWDKKIEYTIERARLEVDENPLMRDPTFVKLLQKPHTSSRVTVTIYEHRHFTPKIMNDQVGKMTVLPHKLFGVIPWFRIYHADHARLGAELRMSFAPTEELATQEIRYSEFGVYRYLNSTIKGTFYESDDRQYPEYPQSMFFTGSGPSAGASEDQIQGMIWILQQCKVI